MAKSSILGGERAPMYPQGRDVDALGPSDSTDSGSDMQGIPPEGVAESNGAMPGDYHADSDAGGTGERASATPGGARPDSDISPDHVVSIGGGGSDDPADQPDAGEADDIAQDDLEDDEDEDEGRPGEDIAG